MDQHHVAEHAGVSPDLLALIADVANVLVEQKEKLTLESLRTFSGYEIILGVGADDLPAIVGHKGKTLDALRLIVSSIGVKTSIRISLTIKGND